jgi:ubiquinone/menaquinone biosynthesis C-methylase UbiE
MQIVKLILAFFVAVITTNPRIKEKGWEWFYRVLATIRPNDFSFINYGYAGANHLPLDTHELPEKYNLQLYHHVAAEIDLTDKDVLEVGCGRGGGAAYIHKYLRPRKMVGLDLADKSIQLCKLHFAAPGLEFLTGNAEDLPFPKESFDALVNVESAVCYFSRENFFREACRVLRPGGYFLYADIEKRDAVDAVHTLLEKTGLTIVRREVINPEVIKACDLDGARRKNLIDSSSWSPLTRHAMYNFAGVPGSYMYHQIQSGKVQYFYYVLRK